jgi:hypothetical protein
VGQEAAASSSNVVLMYCYQGVVPDADVRPGPRALGSRWQQQQHWTGSGGRWRGSSDGLKLEVYSRWSRGGGGECCI